jgi:hypothetical protein
MLFRNGFVSNSSSSSFILGAYGESENISLEYVDHWLHTLLDMYNELFQKNLAFEEVFDPPFVVETEQSLVDCGVIYYLEGSKFLHRVRCTNLISQLNTSFTRYDPVIVKTDFYSYIKLGNMWYQIITDRIFGKIIIRSASENSIPFCLFDIIAENFRAERVHMG